MLFAVLPCQDVTCQQGGCLGTLLSSRVVSRCVCVVLCCSERMCMVGSKRSCKLCVSSLYINVGRAECKVVFPMRPAFSLVISAVYGINSYIVHLLPTCQIYNRKILTTREQYLQSRPSSTSKSPPLSTQTPVPQLYAHVSARSSP